MEKTLLSYIYSVIIITLQEQKTKLKEQMVNITQEYGGKCLMENGLYSLTY
jgi:hypothetical protein